MLNLSTIATRSATPAFEPVSRAEVKKHLEIADSYAAHDSMIDALIVQAREKVEHDADVVTATGTFVWKTDQWPDSQIIELPVRPVSAITSIQYVDYAGTTQTWSSSNYSLDTRRVRHAVIVAYGAILPTVRGHTNDVTFTFVAGYANAESVPQLVKQAMLLDVSREFFDRTGESDRMLVDVVGYQRSYEMIIRRLQRSTYP